MIIAGDVGRLLLSLIPINLSEILNTENNQRESIHSFFQFTARKNKMIVCLITIIKENIL